MGRWVLLLACTVLSCGGSSLPAPATTVHPRSSYVEVPYPPPAALAETVPERPAGSNAVWLDGEWNFHGKVFVWKRGGWVLPPSAGRFAAWRVRYRRDGRLMMAPGTWYDGKRRLVAPEPLEAAATPVNEITSELQTGR